MCVCVCECTFFFYVSCIYSHARLSSLLSLCVVIVTLGITIALVKFMYSDSHIRDDYSVGGVYVYSVYLLACQVVVTVADSDLSCAVVAPSDDCFFNIFL